MVTIPPSPATATAPGEDGEIVASFWDQGDYEIIKVNPDDPTSGSSHVEGVEAPAPGTSIHPSWSPGGLIAYSEFDDDDPRERSRIFTIGPDGNNGTVISSNRAADLEPAWAPVGDRIAFTARVGAATTACATGGTTGSQIAYALDGDIYSVAPDGTGATNLTSTPSNFEGGPAWRADGSKIGFWRQSGTASMYEMDPSGANAQQLFANNGSDEFGPVYSPDGTKVLYVNFAGGSDPEIFVRNASGGPGTQLTDNDAMDTSPDWSCDGTKIVFASDRAGNLDLFTMKADGTQVTNLTETTWNENDPDYSPDGTKIAYTSDQHSDYDVMVMNADGSNASDPLHLTTSSARDNYPTWSPDGTQLSFLSDRVGNANIYVMSATQVGSETKITDTSGNETAPTWGPSLGETFIYTMRSNGNDPQKVTLPINGGNPAWAPDASRIVFSDDGDLFTIMPDGRGLAQLTADHNNTGRDIEPSWSPDGSKVAYVGVDDQGRSSLYTVNVDGGTGLFRLTTGTTDRSPVWSPSGTRIAFVRDGKLFTIKPDGTELTEIRDYTPGGMFISLDWGGAGAPDTILTQTPGQTVGEAAQATFKFRATRFPASFECKLSTETGWGGRHDWRDCGSMSSSTSNEPVATYSGMPKGSYTFYVRAKNATGTDQSPASQQFDVFSAQLVVGKFGNGFGTVTSNRGGLNCTPAKSECRLDIKGEVTLTAKPDAVSVFTGWKKGCSGTQRTCTVNIQNKTVFANAYFDINPNGPAACQSAQNISRNVGSWVVSGCFKQQGANLVTSEVVKLNGLYLVPIGGTLTLDPAGQSLEAAGEVQLMAGPMRTQGQTLGPIVLLRDTDSFFDLSSNAFFTFPPEPTLFGLPIDPAMAIEAAGNSAVVSATTDLPVVLGGGDAIVQFVTGPNGLQPDSIVMGRQVESGSTAMEVPFSTAIADVFQLNEVAIFYDVVDGWSIGGRVAMPTGGGFMGGLLNYRNGQFRGGEFALTDVPIGGLLDIPLLKLSSNDGENWSMSTGSANRQNRQASTGDPSCGSQIASAASGFKVPTTPSEVMNLVNFRIQVPRCELWGDLLVVNNLDVSLATQVVIPGLPGVPTHFQVTGDLAGQASGSFTGRVALTVDSAQVTAPELDIDALMKMQNVVLNWATDGTTDTWTGTADLDDLGGGTTADLNIQTQGGNVLSATVGVANLKLFTAQDTSSGETKPVFNIKQFRLTHVPAQSRWDVTGDVDAPGASVSQLTGSVTLDNNGNVDSGSLDIGRAQLIGYVEVNGISVRLTSPGDWTGRATLVLPGIIEVPAEIEFVDGELNYFKGEPTLSQPLPIGLFNLPYTGVYRIAFSLRKDPLQIGGGLGLQMGPTVFGKRPVTADGDFVARFPGETQDPGFRIDGNVKVMGLKIGDGFVDYTHPSALDIAGCLGDCDDGLKFGPASVEGNIRGQIQTDPFAFQISGNASAGIDLPTPCFIRCGNLHVGVTGRAILSNIGAAVCGSIDGWGTGWAAGVGYKWSGKPEAFTGCDLGSYKSIRRARSLMSMTTLRRVGLSPRQGTTELEIVVPAGLPVQAFRFKGKNGPPLVNLQRPNGDVISVSADTLGQHDDYLIVVDEDTKETIILVDEPEAGTWTVTLQAGSSPLASASESEGLPDAEVGATVSGSGATRTLEWTLTPLEGQTVRFIEVAEDTSQVITETAEATGSMEFTPAPGSGGTRTIVAEISQDGLPRETIEVATFEAPDRAVLSVLLDGSGVGTVTSSPEGISCGDSCEMDLTSPATLTATPAAGSWFYGWTGGCGGNAPTCTVPGDTSSAVGATFLKLVKPAITGFKPAAAAPGKTVTLLGSGFLGASLVKFGKTAALSFTVVSDKKIVVKVPKKARSGVVSVTGPGGTGKSKEKFRVK